MLQKLIHTIKPPIPHPVPPFVLDPPAGANFNQVFSNILNTCRPIETIVDITRVPGTELDYGTVMRLFESPDQERIEINLKLGLRAGCDHYIYKTTDQELGNSADRPHLGGVCPFCTAEAVELLAAGVIDQRQAQERSIFCNKCESYCHFCLLRICADHTRIIQQPDGLFIPVCIACYATLRPSLLKKLLWWVLWPVIDHQKLRAGKG